MQKPPRTGITAFCGCPDTEARFWMLRPWLEGDHIYATNGHILLELPRASNALLDVVEKSPRSPNNIAGMLAAGFAAPEWRALPTLPPFDPCFGCNGTGVDQGDECPELMPSTCEACEGYGETYHRIVVGDTGFCIRYLRLLSSLSGVQISPNGDKACAFTFDGGRGLLMPMRTIEQAKALAKPSIATH